MFVFNFIQSVRKMFDIAIQLINLGRTKKMNKLSTGDYTTIVHVSYFYDYMNFMKQNAKPWRCSWYSNYKSLQTYLRLLIFVLLKNCILALIFFVFFIFLIIELEISIVFNRSIYCKLNYVYIRVIPKPIRLRSISKFLFYVFKIVNCNFL